MYKVHILIDQSRIVDYLIFPIKNNKWQLKDRGYNVMFFFRPTFKCLSCDYLLLVSKPVLNIVNENNAIITEPSPTIDFLKKARKYANKIVWMDNSDSTSVSHFELLPYVDLYLKKQLLKDFLLYKKPFVGGRIFTEYYYNRFGIRDKTDFDQFYPLCEKYRNKVHLSWNIGLGKMYKAFNKMNSLRIRFPSLFPINNKMKLTSPKVEKAIDVFIRTSANLDRKLIAFHRQELLKHLDEIINRNQLTGSTSGKWLSASKFSKMLKYSKILPSPFGWGELGVRDFEAFIYGAVLLKPDISHMNTWPDIFIKGETYIPFTWDFSDLELTILDLLNNDEERIRIAANGQDAYQKSISKEGMNNFCDWFINQINK